jgi:hypothetical protein
MMTLATTCPDLVAPFIIVSTYYYHHLPTRTDGTGCKPGFLSGGVIEVNVEAVAIAVVGRVRSSSTSQWKLAKYPYFVRYFVLAAVLNARPRARSPVSLPVALFNLRLTSSISSANSPAGG